MRIVTVMTMTVALSFGAASATANAQVIGTSPWQMQPYCNRVVLTVVQLGGVYQLSGTDDLCGTGAAPVTGTAVPNGGGVSMGFAIALANGRAAHVSATVSLATLSGPWADADGQVGTFAFNGTGGGSPRPAPAGATSIQVTQFSPAVYAGSGSAATVARSDHTHDDRYYTEAEVNSAVADAAPLARGFVYADGSLAGGRGVAATTWNAGTQRYVITLTGISYFYDQFATVVTPICAGYTARTSSVGGNLLVYVYNTASAPAQCDFAFVVHGF